MRIRKENTSAVLIDIQEKLFPHINNHEELLERTIILIKGLDILGVPITVTEQYTKGLGHTLSEVQEALAESYKPIEKMSFSCCGSDEFNKRQEGAGHSTIILFGIETHVCVLQTALDLLEKGVCPVIPEDAVSSRKLSDKTIAIERLRQEGARITTVESLLFELCVVSGTDRFKAISKLVK